MAVVATYRYEIFADYHQFYLEDEQAMPSLLNPEATRPEWTEKTVANLLAVSPGCVAIGTARAMTVPVTVEIHDAVPKEAFDDWDHITEASLDITSGRVSIGFHEPECFDLPSGIHRLRVYYGGLDSLDEMGLEGDDHYRIVIWQGKAIAPRVLKRWKTRSTYNNVTQNPLIGTYRLVSYKVGSHPTFTYPFGTEAVGFLLYGSEEYMSFAAGRSDKPSFAWEILDGHTLDEQAAIAGYISYVGKYEFKGPSVVHQVETAVFPDLVGNTLEYGVSFSGGNRMFLFERGADTNISEQSRIWEWEPMRPRTNLKVWQPTAKGK